VLYQKTGFLLQAQQERLSISNEFFKVCREKIGLSKRYLAKDFQTGKYDSNWRLIVPFRIYDLKNGG